MNACTQVGQGLFTFIWAKIGQYIEGVKKGTVKLVSVASTAKAAVTDLSATIRYPESEQEFFFMLSDWQLITCNQRRLHGGGVRSGGVRVAWRARGYTTLPFIQVQPSRHYLLTKSKTRLLRARVT